MANPNKQLVGTPVVPKTAHSHVRVKSPDKSFVARIPSAVFWVLYALATLAFWGWSGTHGCGA